MNQAFNDLVSRSTFKGVERDCGIFKIVRSDLSDTRIKELVEAAIKRYGFPDKNTATSAVLNAFDDTSAMRAGLTSTSSVNIRNLPPGSILSFRHDGGHEMRLITTGGIILLVLLDAENALNPGDTLYSIGLNISQNTEAVFQCVRNGSQFPADDKYLVLKDIDSITVHENDGNNLFNQSGTNEKPPIPGQTLIYAIYSDGFCFTPDNLTQDSDALFEIHFNEDKSISYSLNPKFRTPSGNLETIKAEHERIMEIIANSCDIDPTCRRSHISKLKCLNPGTLTPRTIADGHLMLQIASKATVGLI